MLLSLALLRDRVLNFRSRCDFFFVSVFLAGAQPKPVFLYNSSFQRALKLKYDYLEEQKANKTF